MTDAQQALQAFALAVLKQWHGDGERGDLDGAWLQDAAEEACVCVETERVTPCGPVCGCAEAETRGGWAVCMPIHADVFAMMQAERATTPTEGERDGD